jgi:type II secretory pathway component PulF
MLFSNQLPLAALIEFCHLLRLSLGAGLMLRDVFRQLAARGSVRLRPVAERICLRLEKGDSFRAALKEERGVFPPLLLGLAAVGEKTGRLPEVLEELEKYYQQQLQLRRQLRARSLGPVIQFVLAIGVVALLMFLLGAIAQSRGGEAQSVMGLQGASGAVEFLLINGAVIVLGYMIWVMLTSRLGQQATVDGLMLRLPVVGPCVQALVLGRFALALQLTLDTAMPIARALRLSLDATGNRAFANQADAVVAAVTEGEPLAVALSRGRWFPLEFLSMVAVGEEGGRVVEMMRHQAAHYQDEAGRRLTAATRTASGLIWLVYAVFMVLAIMSVARIYFGALGV